MENKKFLRNKWYSEYFAYLFILGGIFCMAVAILKDKTYLIGVALLPIVNGYFAFSTRNTPVASFHKEYLELKPDFFSEKTLIRYDRIESVEIKTKGKIILIKTYDNKKPLQLFTSMFRPEDRETVKEIFSNLNIKNN